MIFRKSYRIRNNPKAQGKIKTSLQENLLFYGNDASFYMTDLYHIENSTLSIGSSSWTKGGPTTFIKIFSGSKDNIAKVKSRLEEITGAVLHDVRERAETQGGGR